MYLVSRGTIENLATPACHCQFHKTNFVHTTYNIPNQENENIAIWDMQILLCHIHIIRTLTTTLNKEILSSGQYSITEQLQQKNTPNKHLLRNKSTNPPLMQGTLCIRSSNSCGQCNMAQMDGLARLHPTPSILAPLTQASTSTVALLATSGVIAMVPLDQRLH